MTIGPDQLSLFVNPFYTHTFDSVLALIREAGLRHIGLPFGVWSDLEPKEIAVILDDHGLGCRVVNVPARVGRLGAGEHVMSLLVGAMELAVAVGADDVQFHFKVDEGSDPGTVTAEVAGMLRPVLELAAGHGVGLLLENNFDSRNEDPKSANPSRSAEAMKTVWEEIGSHRLGFCYDPANFILTGRAPFPDQYEIMAPHIRDIHIKDGMPLGAGTNGAAAETSEGMVSDSVQGRFQWTRLGEGSLPWPAIISGLVQSGYDRNISLEPFRGPGMTLEEWTLDAAATVRNWLSPSDHSKSE